MTRSLCRCCLSEDAYKDMNSSYTWFEKKEVYSEMLQTCFNIVLSNQDQGFNRICEVCIKDLRSSVRFKEEVLKSEEEFIKRITKGTLAAANEVALVKIEPPDIDTDSDDYFLADAVSAREVLYEDIKLEPTEQPEIKKLGTRLKLKSKKCTSDDETIEIGTISDKKKRGLRTISINRSQSTKAGFKRKSSQPISVLWNTKPSLTRQVAENLITILNYSNALPFNDKTLVGFSCAYCTCKFPDPSDLRTHTETEHKKERTNLKLMKYDSKEHNVKLDITDLFCTLCDADMDNLQSLKEHLAKVHQKNIYTDVKDHLMQFKLTKGDVFNCALCTSKYETFKMLKQHMNLHYPNYRCSKCNATFATKRSLGAHKNTHIQGNFKCDLCEKVFPSKIKKQYHEKTKHLGARHIANCPYCNVEFRSYYQRNQHMVKNHNAEALYKCNVCDKGYILKSLLMYHIKKNHLMERDCQCSECGYRFFSKKALKAHMVKHTGERNYNCEVCNKAYARKYTLREHMRIHNDDRRFKCYLCGSSFVQKCSLKSHLLSNHGLSVPASEITTTK